MSHRLRGVKDTILETIVPIQVMIERTFFLQPQFQMVVEYASDTLRAVCLTAPSVNIIDGEKKVQSDNAANVNKLVRMATTILRFNSI